MRKAILILGVVFAFSASATSFPKTISEGEAFQQTSEYQSLSHGAKADVDGFVGHAPFTMAQGHNNPTGEPVNAGTQTKELPAVNQRPDDELVGTGSKNTSNTAGETKLSDSTGVVQPDVRVRPAQSDTATKPGTSGVAEPRSSGVRNDSSSVASDASSRRIASNSAGIEANHHAIESNHRQIETNRRDIRRVGATAVANANLHYDASNSGYAVSLGTYRGETAIAGGLQYGITEHSAATVQVSYDGTGTGASVGFHSSF